MVYVKINSTQSSYGRLKYLFDALAHDGSKDRVLNTIGGNIRLWSGEDGHPYNHQSGYYLNSQFKNVRKNAYNPSKRIQAQHMIVSFAESEFKTNGDSNLRTESQHINELVTLYMNEHFPEAQYVSAVQCDGVGHKLHAHILINSVGINGKCIRTNQFQIDQARQRWNKCMHDNYSKVNGDSYDNPFDHSIPRIKTQPKGWEAHLKYIVDWARNKANDMDEYEKLLESKGVTMKLRNKRGDLSYMIEYQGKIKTVRDFYQRKNKKDGKVKSTRGLGKIYTPSFLHYYFNSKQKKQSKANNGLLNDIDTVLNSAIKNNQNDNFKNIKTKNI